MTKYVKLIFALCVLGVSSVVAAQDADEPAGLDEQSAYLGIRASYRTCIDQSNGTMPSMTECAEGEFAYQDKRLNVAYGHATKAVSVERRALLRVEERDWIKRRDAECAIPAGPGQGQILDSIGCNITETARRARHLEHTSSAVTEAASASARTQDVDGEPADMDEQAKYLGFRPSYYACIDQSDGSMPSYQRCADLELVYQDRRLNRIYGKLIKSLPPDGRVVLHREELAWITGKEAKCGMPDNPGQGQALDSTACAVTETARRARALEWRRYSGRRGP